MDSTRVRTATSVDEAQLVHTMVAAFAADPVVRWFWPNARQYLENMPGFTLAFGGAAFAHQEAHCTEDFSGAALWLPPGAHPDEAAVGQIVEDTVALLPCVPTSTPCWNGWRATTRANRTGISR